MIFKNMPIRKKLMRMVFLSSGVMLLITCISLFIYEKGALYLKSDLRPMYERLQLYAIIISLVGVLSFPLGYMLFKILHKNVAKPILVLAKTANIISDNRDYSVRAERIGTDEFGLLTDAFNNMLSQIQDQHGALQEQQRKDRIKMTTIVLNARIKERNLIGQELHDNVNQILVGTKLFLSMVNEEDQAKSKRLISSSVELIQKAIDENRKIAHTLVASDFEEKNLVKQIGELAENMLQPLGIDITIDINHLREELLEEQQKLAAYRIAQEQCCNIVKYASAHLVIISLSTFDDFFKMIIIDDGQGMDTSSHVNGIGLKNINDRLKDFSGVVNIKSSPGKGFTLEIIMPLKNEIGADSESKKIRTTTL